MAAADGNMPLSSAKLAATSRTSRPATSTAIHEALPRTRPATWAAAMTEDVAKVIPALLETTVRSLSTRFRPGWATGGTAGV